MENQALKHTLPIYIGIIVFPSKYLEKASENIQKSTSFLIWVLVVFSLMIPQGLINSRTSPVGELYWGIWLIGALLAIYPVVYGHGYLLWRLGKGFGGQASFSDIRNTVLFSMVPLIVNLPFTLIYTGIAISRNDFSLASRQSTLVNWIIWLVGFRILVTGIARFNRFSKTQTLMVWFLVALFLAAIQGLVYLARQ
jgi:hypothetical protein